MHSTIKTKFNLKKLLKHAAIIAACSSSASFSQDVCPKFLLDSAMVVNVEGRFINNRQSRTSIDMEWRHHPEALDTFFVNLPNQKPFTFVTAGEYRYMLLGQEKIKRQLGLHHLKENLGTTPLRLDDLELLANGAFLCKDSTSKPNVFSTAFSNMWWSLTADTLPVPNSVTMNGARKEARTFSIGKWKDFSGASLPTLISLSGPNYSGNIWIRSAYPIAALQQKDPLAERAAKKPAPQTPDLFRKVPVSGKREIPLILKLNQELLRE